MCDFPTIHILAFLFVGSSSLSALHKVQCYEKKSQDFAARNWKQKINDQVHWKEGANLNNFKWDVRDGLQSPNPVFILKRVFEA